MPTANLGRLAFVWRGDYSAPNAHAARDIVRFQNNVYVCRVDAPAGTDPLTTANWDLMVEGAPADAAYTLFGKADADSVVFTKTGAGTISLKAGTKIELGGTIHDFAADTAVVMPALTAGTDYAVYVCGDGTVRADSSFSAPTGYTASTSRQIGGFHYAPSNLDIDSTPNINAFSLWDLKWRPACPDPRGMIYCPDGGWSDIYFLGTNHEVDGTSALGATIADGSSPPKIPLMFGGDGTTDYGSLTRYEAAMVLAAHGKRLHFFDEAMVMAYGTTEASSLGSDPVTVQHHAGFTSALGAEGATGVMYTWLADFGGPDSGASWSASTEGRGSVYSQPHAALFGGPWSGAATSGSRCALWNYAPSYSDVSFGARGRCDHLRLV